MIGGDGKWTVIFFLVVSDGIINNQIYWFFWTLLWLVSDVSSMISDICRTALNALFMGSISVDVVFWMMLVILNGEYRIAEEYHINDVG